MAANLPKVNQPRWFCGISFTDPNDAGAPRVWRDFTSVLRSAKGLTRGGAVYELGQATAGQPQFYFRDPDETLNPDNPSGPYAGQILPYRPLCWLGTWPQIAGNLLNSGAWRLPFDPGFESSTVGAQPTWVTAVGGTTPVVGTTTPHAGSRDLTLTVVNGATVQGWSTVAYTMPGTQYTFSAWVRQSSASTLGVYAAGSVGSTTTTTGTYVRLTKTFTATDITTTLAVQTSGTAVAGTVLTDDIQLEEGASATTNTITGPVVYPVFNGFAERFERAWASSGFEGEALVTCVDSLGALNSATVATEYAAALLATAPDYCWSLAGGAGSATFPDSSGNGRASLRPIVGKAGGGDAPEPGASMNIPGDPGGTGVHFPTDNPTPPPVPATILATGAAPQLSWTSTDFVLPATIGTSWGVTLAAWMQLDQGATGGYVLTGMGPTSANFVNFPGTYVLIGMDYINASGGTIEMFYQVANVGGISFAGTGASVTGTIADFGLHLLIGTITQANGGNTVTKLYLDGTLIASTTVTTASLGGMLPQPAVMCLVGGADDKTGTITSSFKGNISWPAAWNRALSASEITALWAAGGLAHSGETSGARVVRHLALGGYAGPSRVSTGSSVMGAPSYSGSIKLLADTQNTVVAEGGCLWAAQDGAVVFEGRQDRWLRLTPVATFGENVAGGEIAYEPDFSLSQDPQYIFADVQVTQSGGPTATGGRTADIAIALKRFFGKPYAATVDLLNVSDCQSLADWTFYTHNRPLTRAAVLTITPARAVGTAPTAPGTWAQAFSLEIGQRVRATRRAKAGNSGAGVTVTLDFFIEAVTYDDFDADTGEFTARYLLSPVGSATSGSGVTFQPWILGDATYGVLGSTTVLGW